MGLVKLDGPRHPNQSIPAFHHHPHQQAEMVNWPLHVQSRSTKGSMTFHKTPPLYQQPLPSPSPAILTLLSLHGPTTPIIRSRRREGGPSEELAPLALGPMPAIWESINQSPRLARPKPPAAWLRARSRPVTRLSGGQLEKQQG